MIWSHPSFSDDVKLFGSTSEVLTQHNSLRNTFWSSRNVKTHFISLIFKFRCCHVPGANDELLEIFVRWFLQPLGDQLNDRYRGTRLFLTAYYSHKQGSNKVNKKGLHIQRTDKNAGNTRWCPLNAFLIRQRVRGLLNSLLLFRLCNGSTTMRMNWQEWSVNERLD